MRLILEDFTKQDVQEIYTEMFDEFTDYSDDIDFCTDCIVNRNVKWFNRVNTKTLGRCVLVGTSYGAGREIKVFDIELNPFLLNLGEDNVNVIKDVIAHEFCHTLPDCQNHGKEFHRKAKIIYDLMGYKIDTKADVDASSYFRQAQTVGNTPYKVICDNCGTEQNFPRLNDKIKNAWQYSCKQCGKPYLVPYKFNKTSGKYVELIPREQIDALRQIYKIPPL